MRRYFNWKLFVVLALGLVVLAATALGLRHWQRGRRASQGFTRGTIAFEKGRWDEAANQLGRYLVIVPDDIPVLLKYADSQLNIRPLKSGNIQQAIAAYRNVLRLAPGHIEAATRLTELYLGVGMPGDAELVADKALQSAQSAELQRMLALTLAGQRKFKEAAAGLEKNIQNNPDNIQAYESLGKLIEQRPEDFNVTPHVWFDEAVKNNPDSASALTSRGAFFMRQDRTAEAIADFDLAETKNFDDPNVRIKLAEQFVAVGKLRQANMQLEIAESNAPASQLLWRVWALYAVASGSKELMAEIAERGLMRLERQPWDFMPVAAELYIRSGRLDKAADYISQLSKKDAAPAATAYLQGLFADANGQWYETVKCWQKALELGKQPESLRLALARTFLKLGDNQSAIKHLRNLVSEQPKLVTARVELARLLGETGRWEESAENGHIAVGLAPDDANAIMIYTLAMSHLADEGQAGANVRGKNALDNYARKLEEITAGSVEAKLLRVQLAVNRADYNEARLLLNQAKKSYPSDTRVIIAEAAFLAAEGRLSEALALLTDLLEKSPDSAPLVRECVNLLWAKNEKLRCVDIVNRAFEQSKVPSSKKQMGLLLAALYAGLNKPAEQCGLLLRLSNQFPDDIPVLRSALTCPEVIKNPAEAQAILDKIKTLEGDAGWQWRYEQAKYWLAAGDFNAVYPQITAIMRENLHNNPDDQPSRILLATAYEKAGDTRLAIATYEEALKRSPGDVRLIIRAAAAMQKGGEYDKADRIVRKSAEIKNVSPLLKHLQVQSFLRAGEYDSAGDILENLYADDRENQSAGLSLALLKLQQGQFGEAEKLLNGLISDDPNYLPATALKVKLEIRRGASDEAIRICDGLIEKLNNSGALILRGKTFALLGQNDKALDDFDRALSMEPNNVEAILARSDFYRSAGRQAEAASDISRAMVLKPDSVGVQKRAILISLAGDAESRRQGLALLNKALLSNPDDVELRLYKARMLAAQGTAVSIEQAGNILESIKKDHPAISDVWALLSEIALQRQEPARALDIVIEGLVRLPKDKALLLLKARIEGQRSPYLAIPTLNALHELDTNDVPVTACLADTLVAAGQYEQAIDLLRLQLNIQKKSDDQRLLKISLGEAFYKSSKYDEASKVFDSLEKSSPGDPASLLSQVRLLSEKGLWPDIDRKIQTWRKNNPDDVNVPLALARQLAEYGENKPVKIAEDLLRQVLNLKPDSSSASYSLALLLQTTGRIDEAVEFYSRTFKTDPCNVVALNNLAWILCENQKQYQQALNMAQRGLEIEPNYVDLLDTRGVALFRLGLLQRAEQDFRRCIQLYPAGSKSLAATNFHLARVQARLGQNDLAVVNLKKAFELNDKNGGLSNGDSAEAQKLLEKLSKGGG